MTFGSMCKNVRKGKKGTKVKKKHYYIFREQCLS